MIWCLGFGVLGQVSFAQPSDQSIELCRIAIYNDKGGQISVSKDKGVSWEAVGKVLYPCNKVNEEGYTASKWAKSGCVAATAVNAIHVKTGINTEEGKGIVFSVVPKEMASPPGYYNSFLSPDSSIYTDIQAGSAIFGGEFSPIVGNQAYYTGANKVKQPIEEGYIPSLGDVITIEVLRPADYPKEIIFENKFAGQVKIDYNGFDEKVIAEVLNPVDGIGRFQGGQFAATGRIRANHTGVIDISTSPFGKVGGFQIIPSGHGMSPEMQNARLLTQWMVVGPTSIKGSPLEGQSPLFSDFLRPVYRPLDPDSDRIAQDLLERFIVDVKYAGEDDWVPMPRIWLDPDLNKPLPSWANSALKNITHIRILFPVE
ncbi:MAG: hypothetical protein AABZ57_02160 [Candidatus Margulisiibacteriota bacterium]